MVGSLQSQWQSFLKCHRPFWPKRLKAENRISTFLLAIFNVLLERALCKEGERIRTAAWAYKRQRASVLDTGGIILSKVQRWLIAGATDRQWSSLAWRILGWSFNSELPSKLFMYRQQKDLQNEQDSFKGWAINTFTLHGAIRFVALSSLPRKRF